MNKYPIGIFDSGVGGLTVCKAIKKLLPNENIIYFGDTLRFPYGTRSIESVVRYSREIVKYFNSRKVKMIVCACNTASAVALPTLIEENDIPIVGVIQAGARAATRKIKSGKVGVIATRATVNSGAYERAIHAKHPELEVLQKHASILVSLVEEGWHEGEIARLATKEYVKSLYDEGVRTLILGCTHFPLLKKPISEVFPDIYQIDTGYEVAQDVKSILYEKNLANNSIDSTIELYASDITENIKRLKKIFFGGNGITLECLRLSEKI
jgi:glutamate racemase